MNHDEREWQAQEAALRNERRGSNAATGDALVARYLPVARALRAAPAPSLPADFAAQMAVRVAARDTIDARFEQVLVNVLLVLFALSAVAVAALYGGDWWHAGVALVPDSAGASMKWLFALSACIGMSWMMGLLRFAAAARRPV